MIIQPAHLTPSSSSPTASSAFPPRDHIYKGKYTHRSWQQLPPELVRYVDATPISVLISNASSSGPLRPTISSTSTPPAIVPSLGTQRNSGIPESSIPLFVMQLRSKSSCRSLPPGQQRVCLSSFFSSKRAHLFPLFLSQSRHTCSGTRHAPSSIPMTSSPTISTFVPNHRYPAQRAVLPPPISSSRIEYPPFVTFVK